jgi:thiol-disulfide isomerase/thioredoxin
LSQPRSLFAALANRLSHLFSRSHHAAAHGEGDVPPVAAAAKPRWKRWLIEALVVAAIFAGVGYWRAADLPEGPAPWLEGTLADGRGASLADMLKTAGGRPVLVSFWATWCPVCKAEEGNIAAVARDWPTLTVAMQSGERVAVARHLHERGLGFAALVDADGAMAREWRVRGVPTHFIVDGRGEIRYRSVGYATEYGLRARLWWIGRQG